MLAVGRGRLGNQVERRGHMVHPLVGPGVFDFALRFLLGRGLRPEDGIVFPKRELAAEGRNRGIVCCQMRSMSSSCCCSCGFLGTGSAGGCGAAGGCWRPARLLSGWKQRLCRRLSQGKQHQNASGHEQRKLRHAGILRQDRKSGRDSNKGGAICPRSGPSGRLRRSCRSAKELKQKSARAPIESGSGAIPPLTKTVRAPHDDPLRYQNRSRQSSHLRRTKPQISQIFQIPAGSGLGGASSRPITSSIGNSRHPRVARHRAWLFRENTTRVNAQVGQLGQELPHAGQRHRAVGAGLFVTVKDGPTEAHGHKLGMAARASRIGSPGGNSIRPACIRSRGRKQRACRPGRK